MAYIVLKDFEDLQDNNYTYKKGQSFPREGLNVLPTRIKELSTTANRRNQILIAEVPDDGEKPKTGKRSKSAEKADEE